MFFYCSQTVWHGGKSLLVYWVKHRDRPAGTTITARPDKTAHQDRRSAYRIMKSRRSKTMSVKLTKTKRQIKQSIIKENPTANSELNDKATTNKNKQKAVTLKNTDKVLVHVRVRICLSETRKAPVFRPNPINRPRKVTRIQEPGVRRNKKPQGKTYQTFKTKVSPNQTKNKGPEGSSTMKKKTSASKRPKKNIKPKNTTLDRTADKNEGETVDTSSCYCEEGKGERCWSCRLRRLILIQDASLPSTLIQSL